MMKPVLALLKQAGVPNPRHTWLVSLRLRRHSFFLRFVALRLSVMKSDGWAEQQRDLLDALLWRPSARGCESVQSMRPGQPGTPRRWRRHHGPGCLHWNIREARTAEPGVVSVPDLQTGLPPVNLPPDFTQQIRALPANTLLHIPCSCRLRMIAAVAQGWQGMAHGNAKSTARLLCPPERISEFVAWETAYVQKTPSPSSALTRGPRRRVLPLESVCACDEMRSTIVGVDHAPTEMVLTRQCADVSKLRNHMHINGDILDRDLLASFDGQLRAWARPSPFPPWLPAASCVVP